MEGTGSPERDRVDDQIGLAKDLADKVGSAGTNANASAIAQMQCHLVEALVRQIRDLDDDIWALKGTLVDSNADLITVLNGGLDVRAHTNNEKKGLFG